MPVQVSGLTSGVTDITVGYLFACAVHNGAQKCWGAGWNGQHGDGDAPQYVTQPVAATNYTYGVATVDAGNSTMCGIRSGAVHCIGSPWPRAPINGANVLIDLRSTFTLT